MGQKTVIAANVPLGIRTATRLRLVGRSAWNALIVPSSWTVVAVFRRSFYCQSPEGTVVCIGAPSIGPGPLNALCETSESFERLIERLRPGMPADQTAGVFWIDGWYGISLSGAREWRPAPTPVPRNGAVLRPGVRLLVAESSALAPRDSLAVLIPLLADPDLLPSEDGQSSISPVIQGALHGIRPLVGWLERGLATTQAATSEPPLEVERLIGLGPGLTPAGDDFLGGVMVALHGLGRADLAFALAERLLPLARERTHAISEAHLACAAEGEVAGVLHEAIASVCSEGTPMLRDRLWALNRFGHTSGWDGLAGAAAVFGAYLRSRRRGEERNHAQELQ